MPPRYRNTAGPPGQQALLRRPGTGHGAGRRTGSTPTPDRPTHDPPAPGQLIPGFAGTSRRQDPRTHLIRVSRQSESDSDSYLATHLARRATDRTCRHGRGNETASIASARSSASKPLVTSLTTPTPSEHDDARLDAGNEQTGHRSCQGMTATRLGREHGHLGPLTRPPSGATTHTAQRHPRRPDPVVPDTRPDRTSASMFLQVRGLHNNPLRSRARRFESCRGVLVRRINSNS